MRDIVTFDSEPAEGTINFSIGQPSADLLPIELVRRASETFFNKAQSIELNYGVVEGDGRFLDSLAGFLTEGYGSDARTENLFVTGGNSQGLDMVSTVFAKSGDTVFVEEPSFFLAFQIFRDHGLKIVGIPMDEDGPCIDALNRELKSHKPAFFYTIPSYQNPSGRCTTEPRRREIVDLASKHDFLVVADEVYQLLSYYDSPPIAYGTMTDKGNVISLGSFSKILAPGLRVGWIQTSVALKKRLLASGFANSGGCISHFSSHIVRQTINDGSLKLHIESLRRAYRDRLEAMDGALKKHFSDIAEWTPPKGGYFFWLRFNQSVDTTPLRNMAPELATGFQDGAVFSSKDQLHNYLRVSFAHYRDDDIYEGISRIRSVFDRFGNEKHDRQLLAQR
ncbi:MAG: PLP-dependent aminotransferase family protein [Proteobacteria bacterium]|nr:PLP-dependent aminotransferase family protein [Pseudomonadota bacterium]MDA0994122.1 PLP-dependent aminotransferase family protein [Pseudomonadota bacterium]